VVAGREDLARWMSGERERLRGEWLARRRVREGRPAGYWRRYREAGGEGDPDETLEAAALERLEEWEGICRAFAERLMRCAVELSRVVSE
jgi:hypothetical protein